MAAPASAAPTAASAISRGVIGRCGDIDGVWIEPVTAHVMMTLRFTLMFAPFFESGFDRHRAHGVGPRAAGGTLPGILRIVA